MTFRQDRGTFFIVFDKFPPKQNAQEEFYGKTVTPVTTVPELPGLLCGEFRSFGISF